MLPRVPRINRRVSVLGALLIMLLVGIFNQQRISDWLKLRGYVPDAGIQRIVATDGFTDTSKHLFYINHPAVVPKTSFTKHCSTAAEQTIVLGCYHGNQNGIYILQITNDERLTGVMRVTSAHEMLHAAYDRLSDSKRQQVNGWLEDYYLHDLKDERVKSTIALYKKSEPEALDNEMHSIFGTEVADLPLNLEAYYKQYFQDRSVVVKLAEGYQAEFTRREKQVAEYDAQLQALKAQITAAKAQLGTTGNELQERTQTMNQLRNSGQTAAYNAQVEPYNALVSSYNQLVGSTKAKITEYNQIVTTRNSIAGEQQQLVSELGGEGLPTIK